MSVEGIGSKFAASVRPDGALQMAALCFRVVHAEIQVLLITSRDTGRWILPKGWPIAGLSPGQTATQEAREEAGVKGMAAEDSVGSYTYTKVLSDQTGLECMVWVYPVSVDKLLRRYPERNQRRRKWFSLDRAADLLQEPEARQVLVDFARHPLVQPSTGRRGKG